MLHNMLAVNWYPEIRGITTVIISVVVLMGSVYLLNGTNLGSRLGFLVSIAALAGWMASMGVIWMIYGIGLKGREPTWKPVQVVRDGDLIAAGITTTKDLPANPADARVEGWAKLEDEDPGRGQAVASADEILQTELKIFKSGEYTALAVYDKGGKRWPNLTIELPGPHQLSFDFLAFRHDPHYALVEVQGNLPTLEEPGRAPARPQVDQAQPKTYVLMIRDLGSRRQPALMLILGGSLIFLILCWMLHRRDRVVDEHRNGKSLEPSAAGA